MFYVIVHLIHLKSIAEEEIAHRVKAPCAINNKLDLDFSPLTEPTQHSEKPCILHSDWDSCLGYSLRTLQFSFVFGVLCIGACVYVCV